MARSVFAVNDDGWQLDISGSTSVDLSSSTNLIGDSGTQYGRGAYRFTSVAIPQAATIRSAVIKLYLSGITTTGSNSLFLACEAADNSAALTTTANNIGSRTKTTSQPSYLISDLPDGYYSFDITDALQEVINRAGWTNGNALTVLPYITAAASISMATVSNSESANAPELTIIYGDSVTSALYPTVSGTGAWTNPNNAFADDGTNATIENSTTGAQIWESFGITGVTGNVDGILVEVEGFVTSNSNKSRFQVELSWDGGTSWTSAKYTNQLTTGAQVYKLGGSDSWGRTFTTSELSNTNFKVRVSCDHFTSTNDSRIDFVRVTVFSSSALGSYTLTASAGTFTLTGQAAGLRAARRITAATGNYTLTGQNAILRRGYTMIASAGSYVLTGQSAILKAARKIVASAGSYALTGRNANLLKGYILTAASGTYALTGNAANFIRTYVLRALQGTYSLTGQAANLLVNRKLTAESGSYSLTGQAASFLKGYIMTASAGTYELTGNSVNFLRTYVLRAASGTYALAGQSVNFLRTYIMQAVSGNYVLTGNSANLLKGFKLIANAGSYALTGYSADLVYGEITARARSFGIIIG